MTEKTAQPEQKPAEAPKKETLEDLYTQYSTPEPAKPAAEPKAEPTKPAPEALAAIQREMAEYRKELQAERAKEAQKRDEADLKAAVAKMAEAAGIEGKAKALKGYLIAEATDDKRLLNLWKNREEQPGAWEKALELLAERAKEEFTGPDPQLEENQRAMAESQKAHSASAAPKKSQQEQVMQMGQAEFQRYWARLAGRG